MKAPKATSKSAAPAPHVTSPVVGKLVYIPPGTFLMGSPAREADRGEDETQHPVTLTRGFYVMESEVTQEMWASVMGSNPTAERCGAHEGVSLVGDSYPVVCVDWEEVEAFARRLSEKEGVTYRLPTEAEWEYAARGGTTQVYAGTSKAESVCQYANVADQAAKAKWPSLEAFSCDDGNAGLATVKSYQPNGYGLYDMTGNVWEWTADEYVDYPSGAVSDPTGVSSGVDHVYRGGSWDFAPTLARVAVRGGGAPDTRVRFLGLRLVRSVAP